MIVVNVMFSNYDTQNRNGYYCIKYFILNLWCLFIKIIKQKNITYEYYINLLDLNDTNQIDSNNSLTPNLNYHKMLEFMTTNQVLISNEIQ